MAAEEETLQEISERFEELISRYEQITMDRP